MIKTLTVTIKDSEGTADISIRGTRNDKEFNRTVVLVTEQGPVSVDSQVLAEALKAVVDFQLETLPNKLSGDPIVSTPATQFTKTVDYTSIGPGLTTPQNPTAHINPLGYTQGSTNNVNLMNQNLAQQGNAFTDSEEELNKRHTFILNGR